MAMNVLLIKPPSNPNLIAPSRGEPLELEYLAASIPEHRVDILDMRFDKDLNRELERFKPQLVGITGYTCDTNMVKGVLKEVKKHDRRIRTVVGGYHASAVPQDFALPDVDAVFLGAADMSFKDYVRLTADGGDVREVKNMALVEGGRLVFTEREPFSADLDALPLPARQLASRYRKRYKDYMGNRTVMIVSSRGCPYRCTFCACWKMTGGKYLTRSPEAVAEEMAGLPEGTDLIFFADDNTLHSAARAMRLSESIKKRNIRKKFTMYARADTVVKHPELIESLRDAGLVSLTVGFEAARDRELDSYKKGTTVEVNNQAIRLLHKMGVAVIAHFMVRPEFTEEDFDHLLDYVFRMELLQPVYTVLTPLPGTELYDECAGRILIRDYDFYDHIHCVLPTALPRGEFYRRVADLYLRTYSFSRYLKYVAADLSRAVAGSGPDFVRNADRLSFVQMLLLRIVGQVLYSKYKRMYRREPLASR